MEFPTWWSQLPDDLKENALAWLPAKSIGRYSVMCKEWNALLSSTKFITNDWAAAPPNNKPWLVLQYPGIPSTCMAYCFYTNTWKRFSLAFLEEKYRVSATNRRRFLGGHRSAAGLLLASIEESHFHPVITHTVSNPVTGNSLQLPTINNSFSWSTATMLVAGEGHGHTGETYKVIALAQSASVQNTAGYLPQRVEIYDPRLKSWSTAGQLPQNWSLLQERSVISENMLYSQVLELNSGTHGIGTFSVQNGTSMFILLPLEDVGGGERYDSLFTCGSRVFLATCIRHDDSSKISDFIIWELDKPNLGSNYSWREIARIPSSLLEDLKEDDTGSLLFECQGIRDLVCIVYERECVHETLFYNLSENTWKWLERHSVEVGEYSPFIFFFEPRPDMKVE